jgi:hypothetical protein
MLTRAQHADIAHLLDAASVVIPGRLLFASLHRRVHADTEEKIFLCVDASLRVSLVVGCGATRARPHTARVTARLGARFGAGGAAFRRVARPRTRRDVSRDHGSALWSRSPARGLG